MERCHGRPPSLTSTISPAADISQSQKSTQQLPRSEDQMHPLLGRMCVNTLMVITPDYTVNGHLPPHCQELFKIKKRPGHNTHLQYKVLNNGLFTSHWVCFCNFLLSIRRLVVLGCCWRRLNNPVPLPILQDLMPLTIGVFHLPFPLKFSSHMVIFSLLLLKSSKHSGRESNPEE